LAQNFSDKFLDRIKLKTTDIFNWLLYVDNSL
jgi:hypothetical protein